MRQPPQNKLDDESKDHADDGSWLVGSLAQGAEQEHSKKRAVSDGSNRQTYLDNVAAGAGEECKNKEHSCPEDCHRASRSGTLSLIALRSPAQIEVNHACGAKGVHRCAQVRHGCCQNGCDEQ